MGSARIALPRDAETSFILIMFVSRSPRLVHALSGLFDDLCRHVTATVSDCKRNMS